VSSILTPRRRRAVIAGGVVACLAAFALALLVGPDGGLPDDPELRATSLSLRGTRALLALAVGGALSAAGAALQALLRNPLADPYIIGVSGGAAVGGALAVAAGAAAFSAAVPLAAVFGAFGASAGLAWFVAREGDGRSDATLLAGVVFNAFASAVITLIKTMLPAERSYALLFWLVGTIGYVDGKTLLTLGLAIAAGVALLLRTSGRLELLALGDDEAARLGVHPGRTKLLVYLACSLLVGACVPVTGMIGFVGLVVPHALRLWLGSDRRLLVAASTLYGAAVLVVFDAAVRGGFAVLGTELPVGVLTALVGAPVFAWALARRLREGSR
jgi:iron complex transport system permease protein